MAKVRSPNYPTADLGTALELMRPAFKAENRNKMSRAVLAKHMGDKTLHGRALTKLGAVRAYGLIEGSGDDLRLSDDAVSVLASPDKTNAFYRDALERLALKPQLFQDIKKQYPVTLPSEHNLSFWLVQQHFTQEAAGKAAKSFLATMRLVYDEPGGYNPPSEEKVEEPVMTPQAQPLPKSGAPPPPRPPMAGQRQAIFPVSEGDVTITFPASLSADGLHELGQYLDIFLKKQRQDHAKKAGERKDEAAN